MKTLKIISKSLVLLSLLLTITSCTNDAIIEDVSVENLIIETKDASEEDIYVLVTFYEDVTEEEKEVYRQYYYDEEILIDWKACDEEKGNERWAIRCNGDPACKDRKDPPIRHTIPIPGQTERIAFGDCSELKKE